MSVSVAYLPTHRAWGLTGGGGQEWRLRTACRDEDPELFFPEGNTTPALIQSERARAICATCPVAARCLAYALERDERHGVWGGTTPGQRAAMRHAACLTCGRADVISTPDGRYGRHWPPAGGSRACLTSGQPIKEDR